MVLYNTQLSTRYYTSWFAGIKFNSACTRLKVRKLYFTKKKLKLHRTFHFVSQTTLPDDRQTRTDQ